MVKQSLTLEECFKVSGSLGRMWAVVEMLEENEYLQKDEVALLAKQARRAYDELDNILMDKNFKEEPVE